ncbi:MULTISPECIES: ATP-binding protein [Saccharothrix]|uniref:ATP-binding protein n=1 Tax=Saccharothrix TaxID=2071 RepID=UPI00093DFA91|nr:ATP-grasp domain-containing protein [Saccharothrix sp. CB00851]OKI31972.1 hypothetical protein A6A25_26340 [Saccharothrix sp. CB00851]
MKVALLGDYRADRLVAPLSAAGAEVVVLGDAGRYRNATHLLDRLDGVDVLLPTVFAPGEEQALPVYAQVGNHWRAKGHEALTHPEGFAALVTDKVEFHLVARQRGWPVPRGVVCRDRIELVQAVADLGFPVVVKQARSESGSGRRVVRDATALRDLPPRFPVLVQRFITGQEHGVELITAATGTVAWPVASLDALDHDCAPWKRARVMPADLPPGATAVLEAFVGDVVETWKPVGPWQIDFAVSDGDLLVIELNGRLGGLANLGWACTGDDPYAVLGRVALGAAPDRPRAGRVALELPLRTGSVLTPAPDGMTVKPFVPTTTRGPSVFTDAYRVVVAVPADRGAAAAAWLRTLDGLLVDHGAAVDQLDRGLRALPRDRR